jgi:hypothetical protein
VCDFFSFFRRKIFCIVLQIILRRLKVQKNELFFLSEKKKGSVSIHYLLFFFVFDENF